MKGVRLLRYPVRSRIWINKQAPPEWEYGEQPDLVNVELARALDELKPTDVKPPFLIVDLREPHEQELMDWPKLTKQKARLPLVSIPLNSLLMGYYPDNLPFDRYLVMCCAKGLRSGRAAMFLKGKGYHVKVLLGGIETLDRLVELQYREPGFL